MRRTFAFTLLLLAIVDTPASAQFWKRFVPVERVAASVDHDFRVAEANGPWMVMATTFTGEGAESQARELAGEFRTRYNLPAYVHEMTFDFTGEVDGRGVDKYGAPVKMKYRNGERSQQWAVLVGDFPSIDDPQAQALLGRVKRMQPQALVPSEDGATAQSYASIRAFQRTVVERLSLSKELGPMRTAFMTRNPILPQEYFTPKGVDKFVEKMNSGVDHSLLDCPQRYTVRVATFRGKAILQGASSAMSSRIRGVKKQEQDPLMEAAENAHLLCEELRAKGWEAYEFHDVEESYVTIGAFAEVGQADAAGGQHAIPEVDRIVRTFGAAYNTPSDPLEQAQLPLTVNSQAEERRQVFDQLFSSEVGQAAKGLNPKFARVPPGSPKARIIPFDIHPFVIEAPKRSVSSSFAWRN